MLSETRSLNPERRWGPTREANRARSKADFKNRIKICESEASETQYWLELIIAADWLPKEKTAAVHKECSELLALFTSIAKKK